MKSIKFNKRLGSASFLFLSAVCGFAGSSIASAVGEEDSLQGGLLEDDLENENAEDLSDEVESGELEKIAQRAEERKKRALEMLVAGTGAFAGKFVGNGAKDLFSHLTSEEKLDENIEKLEEVNKELDKIENQIKNEVNENKEKNEDGKDQVEGKADNKTDGNNNQEQQKLENTGESGSGETTEQNKDADVNKSENSNPQENKEGENAGENSGSGEDKEEENGFVKFVNGKFEYRNKAVKLVMRKLGVELDHCAKEANSLEEKQQIISTKEKIFSFLTAVSDDPLMLGSPTANVVFKIFYAIALVLALCRKVFTFTRDYRHYIFTVIVPYWSGGIIRKELQLIRLIPPLKSEKSSSIYENEDNENVRAIMMQEDTEESWKALKEACKKGLWKTFDAVLTIVDLALEVIAPPYAIFREVLLAPIGSGIFSLMARKGAYYGDEKCDGPVRTLYINGKSVSLSQPMSPKVKSQIDNQNP